MKSWLVLILLILHAFVTVAQTVKVYTMPRTGNAVLCAAGQIVSIPFVLDNSKPNDLVVASLNGCVTVGTSVKEIFSLGNDQFTFRFKQVIPLSSEFKSKKIEFSKFVDIEGELTKSFFGFYGIQKLNAEGLAYRDAIMEKMRDWGFDMVGTKSRLFSEKGEKASYLVAGEIVKFEKGTLRTPGMRIAVMVEWSVYDSYKKKVVHTVKSSGFSDTRIPENITNEFTLALEDALIGLMMDTTFQKIVTKGGAVEEKEGDALEKTEISLIEKKEFNSYGAMIKEVSKSAVTILLEDGSHGSGFLISEDGLILTNNHVIEGSDDIQVRLSNGVQLPAKLLKTHIGRDVALIKMVGSRYTPLAISTDSESADLGTDVVLIGTPADPRLGQTVTKGIVSGMREFDEQTYIQTDVALNSGNSGGPLMNTSGQVVGIAKGSWNAEDMEGLGFVIPIGEALKVLNILLVE